MFLTVRFDSFSVGNPSGVLLISSAQCALNLCCCCVLANSQLIFLPLLKNISNPRIPDLRWSGAPDAEHLSGLYVHTRALHQCGWIQPEEHLAAHPPKQPVTTQLPLKRESACSFKHHAAFCRSYRISCVNPQTLVTFLLSLLFSIYYH